MNDDMQRIKLVMSIDFMPGVMVEHNPSNHQNLRLLHFGFVVNQNLDSWLVINGLVVFYSKTSTCLVLSSGLKK